MRRGGIKFERNMGGEGTRRLKAGRDPISRLREGGGFLGLRPPAGAGPARRWGRPIPDPAGVLPRRPATVPKSLETYSKESDFGRTIRIAGPRGMDYPSRRMDRSTPKQRWRAVRRRDPSFDGSFVFAVLSTGIYCRPSCPARRPRPKQVRFFRTPQDAEQEGFRACKRCGSTPKPGPVIRTCQILSRHLETQLTWRAISEKVGLSPAHLHRIFKGSLGVTPLEYLRILRFERFRDEATSGLPVTGALNGAGFGSSSRLYERAGRHLGMTPGAFARKGAGMTIVYDLIRCPLGLALVAATPRGICAVDFGNSVSRLVKGLKERFSQGILRRDPKVLRFALSRLRRIFDRRSLEPHLPLDIQATAFQAQVWAQVRSIPCGGTRSYRQIARQIGRPTAARAVARACASNPVALLIPCHRVTAADGGMAGYRWGPQTQNIPAGLRTRDPLQEGTPPLSCDREVWRIEPLEFCAARQKKRLGAAPGQPPSFVLTNVYLNLRENYSGRPRYSSCERRKSKHTREKLL